MTEKTRKRLLRWMIEAIAEHNDPYLAARFAQEILFR